MLSFTNYYHIIVEGGNVFKSNPTVRIQLANIKPTVDTLSNIVGINLNKNLLGSTGKRESSGDLDIAINNSKFTKDKLIAILTNWCAEYNFDPKQYIARFGISVHFRTQVYDTNNNIVDNEFVQTDFMFVGDIKWAKFVLANNEDPAISKYSGKHRGIILSNLAKNINARWGNLNGIINKDTGDIIEAQSPARVAQLLLGNINATENDLATVSNILRFLYKKYNDAKFIIDNILPNARHVILLDGLDIADLLPTQKITENTNSIKTSGVMQSSGRQADILHLYSQHNPETNSIGFENFEEFVNELSDNSGKIQPGNSSVLGKINGLKCKFGITEDNKFFLQTSNSNGLITDGDFDSKSAKTSGAKAVRSAFENNFAKIKKHLYPTLLQYKKQLGTGIKVQAEWLYSPFATPREDKPGVVYWIGTDYSTDKIGRWLTFALINITDLNHNNLQPETADYIMESLTDLSNDDIKIIPANIDMFNPIDLTEELQKVKQELSTFYFHYPNYQAVLYNPSRKQIDTKPKKELREHLQRVLLPIQRRMQEKILKSVDTLNSSLGEFEGLVIKLNSTNGVPLIFKVTTPTLRKNKGRV